MNTKTTVLSIGRISSQRSPVHVFVQSFSQSFPFDFSQSPRHQVLLVLPIVDVRSVSVGILEVTIKLTFERMSQLELLFQHLFLNLLGLPLRVQKQVERR